MEEEEDFPFEWEETSEGDLSEYDGSISEELDSVSSEELDILNGDVEAGYTRASFDSEDIIEGLSGSREALMGKGDSEEEKRKRIILLERNLLEANQRAADRVRSYLMERGILAINLLASPGAGKTTLLVETIRRLSEEFPQLPIAVIEGDQQTDRDAERIAETGVATYQINTGTGCHLEAEGVEKAIREMELPENSLLFIENVGNLVCPALFDIGEAHKVVLLSVTEGEDKPLKYPHIFRASDLMLVNKIDLLSHVEFGVESAVENAKKINPNIEAIALSAKTGENFQLWLKWLKDKLKIEK